MTTKNTTKNSACACAGLFFISLSLILMTQIHFDSNINSQIQNISLLKDIRYSTWGQHPNPTGSQFNQSFTLFNLEQIDGHLHSVKSNISRRYKYSYEYQNASFSQGNSGRLNFINKWQLHDASAYPPKEQNIKTMNLAADKVFNYDYYAPPQRKLAILFDYITTVISDSFLQKFYTTYLYEFYFKYKDLVLQTVFKPMGFDQTKANAIYSDSVYGWNCVDKFKIWVRLALKGQKQSVKLSQYESLMVDLGLTSKQLQNLLFQKSTLYSMIAALNGTIKSKVMMAGKQNYNYKCSQASCTNFQLAIFQMVGTFLTSDPLFSTLNLNTTVNGLNSTFLGQIQYGRFCEKNKLQCISKSNMIKFLVQKFLGNFESINFLWKNRQNYAAIQAYFDIQINTGRSISEYIQYIYAEYIQKYEQNFAWAQTNYNHIQNSVMTYKNLFLVQLYSRAFYNKFLQNKNANCSEFFKGQTMQFANLICTVDDDGSKNSWNFVQYPDSLRKIMKAYFYIQGQRSSMASSLQVSHEKLIILFNDIQKSVFAQKIQQIQSIFKSSFRCLQNDLELCSPDQLFCMQWGSNKIFQNLPIQIFSNKIKNINEWDTNNELKGLNPDYHAIVGKQIGAQQCSSILSTDSQNGIFSFFNILRMTGKNSSILNSKDILKYIGRNVISINFNGILSNQSVQSLFQGFKSNIITQKQQMSTSKGGAPWLQNQIKLVKTNNKDEIKNNQLLPIPQFDTIDTGIYKQQKTRQMTKIWGQTRSSSKYTVYIGKKTTDEGEEVPVDIFEKYITNHKVEGTNLLGFHPRIENGQNLQIFVTQAYQPMTLSYDQKIKYTLQDVQKQIQVYKYKIVINSQSQNEGTYIGVQELNQNYFTLQKSQSGLQSYAIVQPTTGVTLQLMLSYKTRSNPIFTKFILESNSNFVDLYSSQLIYKRKGLSEIHQVKELQKNKKIFTIVSIVIASVSFIAVIVLVIINKRLVSKNKQLEQNLIINNEATISTF